jgi:HEAT repeat protein
MLRVTCATLSLVLLAASVGGQPPSKPPREPEVTPEWLRRSSLASDSPEGAALRYLYQAGERAFPACEVILADPTSNPRLVVQILTNLLEVKADRSRFLPVLRKRLTDPEPGVRLWTIALVGQVGTRDDLPPLVAFLACDHKMTVKMAASAVAHLGGEAALTALDVWLLTGHLREDQDIRQHVTKRRDELKERLDKQKKQPGK